MNRHYGDILDKISEQPQWYDDHAVPRFCPFSPQEMDIYTRQCVLFEIECQGCQRPFKVAMCWDSYEVTPTDFPVVRASGPASPEVIEAYRTRLHYGDPPNVNCCAAGPTMNSVPKKILEFWVLTQNHEWGRRPEFEVELKPDWVSEES